MNELIKDIAKSALNPLKKVSEVGATKISEFDIECGSLEDYNNCDIRKSPWFETLFIELQKFQGPCLYFFTITSKQSATQIVERIRAYSSTENSKSIPAIKKQFSQSNILYVGKVKRDFYGRVIQHLGYYKVNQTQGLQLFYWAQDLNLCIKLTVLEFDTEMMNLMEVLENGLAKELKPILGKHK
jgi:hypothetical protein